MVAQGESEESTMSPGSFMPVAYAGFPVDGGPYRWNNQFVMGTYLRGGQSYYGLTLSCALDSRGRNVIVARGQYGLGELRGNDDDFVDWTLGMDFNLFPETYVVYPLFRRTFRHAPPVRGNRQRQGLPDCRAPLWESAPTWAGCSPWGRNSGDCSASRTATAMTTAWWALPPVTAGKLLFYCITQTLSALFSPDLPSGKYS